MSHTLYNRVQQHHTLQDLTLPKMSMWDKIQTTAYSAGLAKYATWIVSAVYVLVFQAVWWGHSLKHTWDHLNQLWHFHAVPIIGGWLYDHWDIGRHLYFRDDLEVIVAYALVAMIVVKLATASSPVRKLLYRLHLVETPEQQGLSTIDKVARFLHIPYPGQERDTSFLQFMFLLPSMLFLALPGEVVVSALVFVPMAFIHRTWLTPAQWWVPIVIGIAAGRWYGHRPAIKAGETVQRYFLERRNAVGELAGNILSKYRDGVLSMDEARDKLTALPKAKPGWWYPFVFRARLRAMLAVAWPSRKRGKAVMAGMLVVVGTLLFLGIYGAYIRQYGVDHCTANSHHAFCGGPRATFWMP